MQKVLQQIVDRLMSIDSGQAPMPQLLLEILQIQYSLINISYLKLSAEQVDYFPYIRILQVIGRPQILIQIAGIEYFTILLSLLYCLTIFLKFTGWQYIAVYASLLDLAFFNFLVEQQLTYLQIANCIILFIITLQRTLITRSKFDINVKNTDHIENNFIFFLHRIMVILQIISNQINDTMLYTVTIMNQCIFAFVIFNQTSSMRFIIAELNFCIQLISLYYTFLIIQKSNEHFTVDLIFVPFIYKLGAELLFRWNLKTFKSNDISQQLLNLLKQDQLQFYHILSKVETQEQISANFKILSHQEQVIYASSLIQEEPLKSLKILLKIRQLNKKNIIWNAKVGQLINKALHRLRYILESTGRTRNQYVDFANLMGRESLYHDLFQEVTEILSMKINLLINYNSQIRTKSFYQDCIKAINKIIDHRQKIANSYKLHPTQRCQAVYEFFLAEVLNDFIAANDELSQVAASLGKLKEISTFDHGSIPSYMLAEYNEQIIINQVSSKFADHMKQPAIYFIGRSIEELIPMGVREHHNVLVDQFLLTGQSKFYRTTDSLLIQQPNCDCVNVELCFDVSFTNNKIIFIIVLQQTVEQCYCLIVDAQDRVQACSQSFKLFLSELGIFNQFIRQDIQRVIPNIDQLRQQNLQFEEVIINIGLISISAQVKISVKILNNKVAYSILTFLSLKILSKQSRGISSRQQSYEIQDEIQENERIDIPRESLQISDRYFLSIANEIISSNQIQSHNQSQEDMLIDTSRPQVDPLNIVRQEEGSIKSISINDQKISENIQENMIPDNQSVMSTYQRTKTSPFFKKYQIVQKLNSFSGLSKSHKLHFAFLGLCILSSLLLGVLQLATLDQNIASLVSDIDLLQIKNIATQPIETFQITRYTIRGYNSLLSAKVINQSQYTQLTAYPRSHLSEGFNLLNSNLQTVMNRADLQKAMVTQAYYPIYTKTLGRQMQTVLMNLRTFIDVLLNHQYTSMTAYLYDGAIVADSPNVLFQQKNYPSMKQSFQAINAQIYQQTIQTTTSVQFFSQTIFILIYGVLSVFMLFACYFRQMIIMNCDKYYQVFGQLQEIDINYELKRLKQLQELITQDENYIFSYKFNLDISEKTFQVKEPHLDQRKKLYTLQFTRFTYIPFILMLIIVVIDSLGTYLQSDQFLKRYPSTIKLYWQMSDVGTDVPAMYATREAIYLRPNYPYFTDTDVENLWIQVMQALRRTQQFISSQYSTDLVISTTFINKLNLYNQESLCPYIPKDKNYNDTFTLCQQVLGGNLQSGLKQLLTFLANSIQTDQQLNNFTVKNYYSYLELEGIYMTSQLIRAINDEFRTDLLNQTNILITEITAYNIIYFISLLALVLLGYLFYYKTLIRQYYNCQRLIFLVPRNTIFMDDQFERSINMRIIYDVLN